MRRLLIGLSLVGVLLIPFAASAAMLLSGVGGAPVATATYTGPGDVVSGALHFWGVFSYNAANVGNKVLSACYSGTCADISTGSNGKLPSTITVNGGNCASVTCTIEYFYDQGSGGLNVGTGIATANQPRLMSNCNSKGNWGALYDNGAPDYLYSTGTDAAQSQPLYLIAIADRSSGTGADMVVSGGTSGQANGLLFANSSGNFWLQGTSNTVAVTVTEGALLYIQGILHGAMGTSGSLVNINGTETTSGSNPGSGGMSADNAYGFGSSPTGSQVMNGCVFAAGVWQTPTQPNSTTRASMYTALQADFP